MGWTVNQIKQVKGLLAQFNGSAEVCAVVDCKPEELDDLCIEAFGIDFEAAKQKFSAQGRAMIRKAQFQAAIDGDKAMLQLIGKEQLGQDGGKAAAKPKAEVVKLTPLQKARSKAAGK